MRIRIRGPKGQTVINLPDDASVADLQTQISEATSIKDYEIKYGYPPQSLPLEEYTKSSKLSDIGVNLNGEQLIVSEKAGVDAIASSDPTFQAALPKTKDRKPASSLSTRDTMASQAPLSLTHKPPPTDAPELPLPTHEGTLILRIMPDDNSCLFRAFNSAFFGAMDNMQELRSIIAQTIQAQPDAYPAVVLEKDPDDYCRWIQTSDAWGGAIELDILSRHFDIEICSIDVQALRVDRFNEGRPSRCILVYSGIHYDTIALSPSDPPYEHAFAPPEFDTKVFEASDDGVLEKAVELCKVLHGQHYYTDTAGFSVRCNICGGVFTGEKGATEHASKTGHYDFGEAA
ncbi:ubiquitin-specific protease otu1 [Xylographa carneopallida]|nr:ubiquitin-specific protease otu1 [Xylographa carneopallida]